MVFIYLKGKIGTTVLFRNCSLQIRVLTADVLVLRGININWSRRDAEHKSAKTHAVLSTERENCCWKKFRDQVAQCFFLMAADGLV